jgi:hypothetical protein
MQEEEHPCPVNTGLHGSSLNSRSFLPITAFYKVGSSGFGPKPFPNWHFFHLYNQEARELASRRVAKEHYLLATEPVLFDVAKRTQTIFLSCPQEQCVFSQPSQGVFGRVK